MLHFGTHGSLEFMPGKQVGMSGVCYPDSLIGELPNLYYYAANNPSEATIAKRRSYANTISYLTPPAENAGLYKGLKVGPSGHLAHMPGSNYSVPCVEASRSCLQLQQWPEPMRLPEAQPPPCLLLGLWGDTGLHISSVRV